MPDGSDFLRAIEGMGGAAMVMRRRVVLGMAALGAAAVSVPGAAQAQHYPSKPLKLIVPYPPGAATDNITRAFGLELSKVMGQPVVV